MGKQTSVRDPQSRAFHNIYSRPVVAYTPGNGPDSRTTEIFIVMPGTGEDQLDYFGENSWETPFAVVLGDLDILNEIYSGYGDMPPEGAGERLHFSNRWMREMLAQLTLTHRFEPEYPFQVRTRLGFTTPMATSTSLRISQTSITSIDAT